MVLSNTAPATDIVRVENHEPDIKVMWVWTFTDHEIVLCRARGIVVVKNSGTH